MNETYSVAAPPAATPLLCWRLPENVPASERPPALWNWLVETESLTERLRGHCRDDFAVRVLGVAETGFDDDERAWTGVLSGVAREVYLCGGGTPWVYARTLAAGGEPAARLRALGGTSLGDWAFAQPSARRGPIDVARLTAADALYRRALPDGARPAALWSRRSMLTAAGASIFIYECFLEGGAPWR